MMQIQQTLCIHRRPRLLLELWTFLKEVFLQIQTWILSCQLVAHILASHIGTILDPLHVSMVRLFDRLIKVNCKLSK